jgi:alpha-glucosidase
VRGGAIVPMGPVMQCDGEWELAEITLLVYPPDDTQFTLYEDDGETNAWRDGGHALTGLYCGETDSGCVIAIGAFRGATGLIPDDRRYVLRIRVPRRPHAVTLDGEDELAEDESGHRPAWWQDGNLAVGRPAHDRGMLHLSW